MTMTVTDHEASEWGRMAKAAYADGCNAVGHRYSVASAMYRGKAIDIAIFDELQDDYRAWLIGGFNR